MLMVSRKISSNSLRKGQGRADHAPGDTQMTKFNPNDHMLKLKSKEGVKDYLPVQWRLVWFRQECPQGTIDTEEIEVDLDRECEAEAFVWNSDKRRSEKVVKRGRGYARFKAIITTGDGGRATGHKAENAANFGDHYEKSETGAIGRALAALGFGTQFSDEEYAEGERIVDAPVARKPEQANHNNSTPTPAPTSAAQGFDEEEDSQEQEPAATEQQVSSIRKLSKMLSKAEPKELESMSNLEAKKVIQQLTAEYRQMKKAS